MEESPYTKYDTTLYDCLKHGEEDSLDDISEYPINSKAQNMQQTESSQHNNQHIRPKLGKMLTLSYFRRSSMDSVPATSSGVASTSIKYPNQSGSRNASRI